MALPMCLVKQIQRYRFLHSDQSVNSMSEESVGFSGHVFSHIFCLVFLF